MIEKSVVLDRHSTPANHNLSNFSTNNHETTPGSSNTNAKVISLAAGVRDKYLVQNPSNEVLRSEIDTENYQISVNVPTDAIFQEELDEEETALLSVQSSIKKGSKKVAFVRGVMGKGKPAEKLGRIDWQSHLHLQAN
uniref:Uncharacterized protein n=1 Tax=Ditylenchus dipsaci TaxID=166011 RepID=A0A915DZX5_9BILA